MCNKWRELDRGETLSLKKKKGSEVSQAKRVR